MSEMSGEFGIALGVAVLGSIGAAVYRGSLALDADVPEAAAAAAREGITGAVPAAAALPDAVGAPLLAAAREAYTSGLTAAASVGCLLFLALAVVAARTLRHLEPSGAAGGSAEVAATPAA
jgi:DHA2 family multidrug resistance protein-like MFS transporter